MKKKFAVLIAMILGIVMVLGGCGAQEEAKIEAQTVKIAVLSGPTGMGMAEMMVEKPELADGVELDFTLATAADQITADIINGTYQIAAVPTNLAATLYNKTDGAVVLGCVNTLGNLTILGTKDQEVGSIQDLKGKTIAATGQGANPEYILKALLEKNGLNPDTDVTIKWYGEHAEAASALASGEVSIAMLPQPFATSAQAQNSDLTELVDLNTAWEEAYGSQLEMGCVVVNKEWADSNAALLAKFMDAYSESVNSVNADTEESAQYVVDAGIMQSVELAEKAIPNCAITFIKPADAKDDLNTYLEILHDYNADAVGGDLPATDSDFYSLSW